MVISAGTNTLHMAESLTNVNGHTTGRAGVRASALVQNNACKNDRLYPCHPLRFAVVIVVVVATLYVAIAFAIVIAIAMVDRENGKDGKDRQSSYQLCRQKLARATAHSLAGDVGTGTCCTLAGAPD